jgi:uncharacterized membrane protein
LPRRKRRAYGYPELLFASALIAAACAAVPGRRSPTTHETSSVVPDVGCPAAPMTTTQARSLVDEYCVSCHSASGAAGEDYDFRSDSAILARRRNIEAKLRLRAMPPPNARQPSEAERASLRCWAQQ